MKLKEDILNALTTALKGTLGNEEISQLLETPPDSKLGDLSFPAFKLCKEMKCKPTEAAKKVKERLKVPKGVEKVEVIGPYVNFFFKKGDVAKQVLEEVLKQKEKYGRSDEGKKKKIMVEYSAPNTNKPLHIGHLRNGSLGMAISNILENAGYKMVRANLINDRGIHICKSMLAYKKWGNGKTPESEGVKSDRFVGDYYVKFSQEAEKNPGLNDEAQEVLKKWEAGDRETIALWKKMNKWVLDGMKKTYKEFGSEFDKWIFESKFFGNAKQVIEEGLKKGLFEREEDGAIIARLEQHGISDKTVLRADGTSLYITNDLIATKYKFEAYKLTGAYWVVGNEQNHYFKQLFLIFKLLGYKWADNCVHLSYGMVTLPEGKLKSREGKVVDADDLIAEMKEIAEKEVRARYGGLKEEEIAKRAKIIALGAVKFFLLRTDSTKEVLFDPKKAISFEGESGPYVMYAYARGKSILKKAPKSALKGAKTGSKADFSLLQEEKEKQLVKLLGGFPTTLEQVVKNHSPHSLCQYLLELAASFNSYYHDVPVLKGVKDAKLIAARAALVEATCIVLKKGLNLLGVNVLEEM